ncbi:MAG: hypothetical protein ACRD4I_11605 [Candidatus Angelobacter sp.]
MRHYLALADVLLNSTDLISPLKAHTDREHGVITFHKRDDAPQSGDAGETRWIDGEDSVQQKAS